MEKAPIKLSLNFILKILLILLLIVLGFIEIYLKNCIPSNNIEEENKARNMYSKIQSNGYNTKSMLSYPSHNSKIKNKEQLKEEDIIYIAYNEIPEEEFTKTYDDEKFEEVIGKDFKLYTYYKDNDREYMKTISKEAILNKAKELFGNNIFIENYNVNIAVDIFYKDGYYYQVYDIPASGGDLYHWSWNSDYFFYDEDKKLGFETRGFSEYDKYELKDNDLIIYEYYINAYGSEENIVFASKTSNFDKEKMFEITYEELKNLRECNWTDNLKEKAGYYEHTFKKDETGNYYWHCSKLIN